MVNWFAFLFRPFPLPRSVLVAGVHCFLVLFQPFLPPYFLLLPTCCLFFYVSPLTATLPFASSKYESKVGKPMPSYSFSFSFTFPWFTPSTCHKCLSNQPLLLCPSFPLRPCLFLPPLHLVCLFSFLYFEGVASLSPHPLLLKHLVSESLNILSLIAAKTMYTVFFSPLIVYLCLRKPTNTISYTHTFGPSRAQASKQTT